MSSVETLTQIKLELAELIRMYLLDQNITQTDLARLAGVDIRNMTRILKGNTGMSQILKVVEAMGVQLKLGLYHDDIKLGELDFS